MAPEGWHTSFRLNRVGGYVGLFGPGGQVVDEVTFGPQVADVSLGRLGTASDQWVFFPTPTPGKANTTPPRTAADAPPVVVTPRSGRFTGPMTVQLAAPAAESMAYYTLDGTDPTVGGQAYTAPVAVTETTVLRTVALRDGIPVSAVTTATYLVGERIGLPVVSLVMDPAHLWDEDTGISTTPRQHGRRGERPVMVEWLSPEGALGFSVPAGLRIRGSEDRTEAAKQSLELYFRAEYGSRELTYPLFGPQPGRTYTRLALRAEDQDSWQCREGPQCVAEAMYLRDHLVRELHGAMGQAAARGRWVALYLNGASWGLYHPSEQLDENFLATHFDTSAWYTSAPAGALAPDNAHRWQLFADWLTGADLSTATQYEQAVQQLDIESFTAFVILHLWNGDTAARYAQTATPLIFWEPRRLLEATQLARWGGTRPEQLHIRIVDAEHPITAGLPVDQPLRVARWTDTLSVAWPTNGPGVQVLAKHLFGNDYAILVAEAGAELTNGQSAPARTVFWFWHHDTFRRSTGDAVRLFDRAVDWALRLPVDDGA